MMTLFHRETHEEYFKKKKLILKTLSKRCLWKTLNSKTSLQWLKICQRKLQ